MAAANIQERAENVLCTTYARIGLTIDRGEGVFVWDDAGRQYMDLVAGLAVCGLGHAHPAVAEAVCRQAKKLVHTSNLYYTENQVLLAEWLRDNSFADRVFFCNSGAEANGAAIKLARKVHKDRGETDRYEIITMENSFHGRTLATLTATGQDKVKKGFDPLPEGFVQVPFGDIGAVRRALTDRTAAVLVEPVQGEGGVCMPPEAYLPDLRALCDEAGILLMFDEIQTGMGRTGAYFAHQKMGAAPDVMTLAKGLANGLPIGAMLATEAAAGAFSPGTHATTFGGTPLVCAAGLAVVRTLEEENILDNVNEVGGYFRSGLEGLAQKFDCVEEVRGMGLMLGLRLNVEGGPLVVDLMDMGFLVNCTQNTVLRFLPPLILEKGHVDDMLAALDDVLSKIQ